MITLSRQQPYLYVVRFQEIGELQAGELGVFNRSLQHLIFISKIRNQPISLESRSPLEYRESLGRAG
jgi:hypothetical protein